MASNINGDQTHSDQNFYLSVADSAMSMHQLHGTSHVSVIGPNDDLVTVTA